MKTVWDPNKAKRNLRKHNVHFSDAENVFFDPYAITIEDISSAGEQRYITIGMDPMAQVLIVVFTYREDEIRLISARRATKKEIYQYETGI